MTDDHLYRRGVGVMLLNADRHVWVGRRIDNRDEAWQMPQGGLDQGEAPWAGALRELEEETGIAPRLVEKIADHPQQLKYDIPDAIAFKLWKGKYKGQVQDWYLARFLGTDAASGFAILKTWPDRSFGTTEVIVTLGDRARLAGSR